MNGAHAAPAWKQNQGNDHTSVITGNKAVEDCNNSTTLSARVTGNNNHPLRNTIW